MMDADKRDSAVAYIEADPNRLELIRILEKKSEPLTLEFLSNRFSILSEGEILKILTELEGHELISEMSEDPSSWDLSLFGREILYALEPIPKAHKFSPSSILRRLAKIQTKS